MSDNHHDQSLDTIAFHSASPAIEATFTAAARRVFGDVHVQRVEGDTDSWPSSLARALLVIAHPETDRSVGALRELREYGVASPALLLVQDEGGDFEADLAELGPAAAFPSDGFAPEDLENCVRALEPNAFTAPAAPTTDEATPAAVVESVDSEGSSAGSGEEDGLSHTTLLESLDDEEATLLRSIETVRQNRRDQVSALGKAASTVQRRLEAIKKQLAKTQEGLSLEKRQRWEVVLDLRESQERIKEVEERLQKARDGETRRQRDLDALRIDHEQRSKELSAVTRERDTAQQRLEQAQKGLEKKTDQSRARIEELREEADRLREEHAKTTRELEDKVALFELELEEAKREVGQRAAELTSIVTQRRALEADLLEARETMARDREQGAARVASLEEDSRKLRHRLEQVAQAEGGRAAQLDAERKAAVEALEQRTEELSKVLASGDALEKELHELRAQYDNEREESQAWIGELEREVERLKTEQTSQARHREGELGALRGQLDKARGELEAAKADVAETAQTLAEVEAAKTALDQRMAELAAKMSQERDESQVRITKLQEERDRLDARVRRSSADTGKVSDLQKEIDTLLAELADKEEVGVALRTGNETLERELEEARAALGKEKEETTARLASLVAQKSDLERQVQEAHDHRQTLERQMASLRAEVVELEVAREEDAERLREMGSRENGAKAQRGGEDLREERDRLKRELDAMRVDAENTRRALADSDARLRKLQQEKSPARPERDKAGDLAIQQLRAELGSLGD
jgi:chromosome segregation ATPase